MKFTPLYNWSSLPTGRISKCSALSISISVKCFMYRLTLFQIFIGHPTQQHNVWDPVITGAFMQRVKLRYMRNYPKGQVSSGSQNLLLGLTSSFWLCNLVHKYLSSQVQPLVQGRFPEHKRHRQFNEMQAHHNLGLQSCLFPGSGKVPSCKGLKEHLCNGLHTWFAEFNWGGFPTFQKNWACN